MQKTPLSNGVGFQRVASSRLHIEKGRPHASHDQPIHQRPKRHAHWRLQNRQMTSILRQMPNHKARSHPANTVVVHTHPLVKDGLGAGAYSDLRSALGVSDQKLADSLSIPMRTLQRRLGRGRFMPDESDRIARLSRIYQRAREVLESADSAREWMQTPNPSVGFAVPLELCSTDPGCVEVERLLYRIEYGVF
jgi:putative toxin-antitoxin system antitoxin component (TIGR02293 family)